MGADSRLAGDAPNLAPGPRLEVVKAALDVACRAPSLHNSQPWRWVFDGSALHLYGDASRLLPEADPFGRQLLLSCGAVLDHLKAAIAVHGWRAMVVRFPDPSHHGHLAAITFAPAPFVTPTEHRRAEAIERRRTDRLPFAAPTGWADFSRTLTTVMADHRAALTFLPLGSRAELAEASRLTASRRRYDSMYRAELLWWTGRAPHNDGVPATALISPADAARVPVGRPFPPGDQTSAGSTVAVDESQLVVLGSLGDDPMACLTCGEALSAVLLEATMAGYATCPLTHVTELPASRAIVAELTGDGAVPQVVVRIGSTSGADIDRPRTRRRGLQEVLHVRPAERH